MRTLLPLILLCAALLATPAAAEPPTPVAERWRRVATVELPLREVSGLAPLPPQEPGVHRFLVVVDEGRLDAKRRVLTGALHRLALRDRASGAPVPESEAVDLDVGEHLARLDPAWLELDASPVDFEGITPLPGLPEHFLVSGERNPDDQTDNGANRLYVVRCPSTAGAPARLLAYIKVPDLLDDLTNDRFEGVCALPSKTPTEWHVYLFKERTAYPGRRVGYVHGLLRHEAGGWRFTPDPGPGSPPLRVRFLSETPGQVATQTDACRGPGGEVWVLDRWNRLLHRTKPGSDAGLARTGAIDFFEAVREIREEAVPLEPAAPAFPGRPGLGRHEAVALDPGGWLFLASDRGEGLASTLTILAPR